MQSLDLTPVAFEVDIPRIETVYLPPLILAVVSRLVINLIVVIG